MLELSDSQLVFGRRDLRAVAGFFLFEGGGSRLGFDSPIDFPDWCWPLGQFKMSHITSRTLGFRPFGYNMIDSDKLPRVEEGVEVWKRLQARTPVPDTHKCLAVRRKLQVLVLAKRQSMPQMEQLQQQQQQPLQQLQLQPQQEREQEQEQQDEREEEQQEEQWQ